MLLAAVLGPTNTGKTHYAIERMLSHRTGIIGMPLRLLVREVYNRVVARVGAEKVALLTGEEKIKPANARYWICTVESMPLDVPVDFVAIDEIQLAADRDRGHVFTDRLLNRRGLFETLLLGAETMRPLLEQLLPGIQVTIRPRLSRLDYAGHKKITRLPPRSAVVAFSADEVYAIAELIRRQHGGAAVVLGALSPRTRNAQVELYQNGDVDYLVATDAIGMGLNLDVDHIAFARDAKFDGFLFRPLDPAERAQVAGRAGRHVRDGTFGTTGRCLPFDDDTVEQIVNHTFQPVRVIQWRNTVLDMRSIDTLQNSLAAVPSQAGLTRSLGGEDSYALDYAAAQKVVRSRVQTQQDVELLWDVCKVPDYRKVSPTAHAELVTTIYTFLADKGRIPADWFAAQMKQGRRVDGDIDTLSARLAHVRTWAFVAHHDGWLHDQKHWQGIAREIEDRLSDALHDRLTQRFVDRRTSILMRRLREKKMLEAELTTEGDVQVEGQHVGRLSGFRFTPDNLGEGLDGKALRAAANNALVRELTRRAERLNDAPDTDLVMAADGTVRWLGEPVGRLIAGDSVLSPRVHLLADDILPVPSREKAETRLKLWVDGQIEKFLAPLKALSAAEDLSGLASGIGFRLVEALGVIERNQIAEDMKALDQEQRTQLRKYGVRFGAYHIYLPLLLKPAPRALAAQLWGLSHPLPEAGGLTEAQNLAGSGRTSFMADPAIDREFYRLLGYRVCGERAVRVDILERMADLIRPAVAFRVGATEGTAPDGAAENNGFTVTIAMTSLVGCAGEDFSKILRSLGYKMELRPAPAVAAPEAAPQDSSPAEHGETAETTETASVEPAEVSAAEATQTPAEPAEPAAAAQEITETQAEETTQQSDAPAEPAMVEVWRPAYRQEQGRPQRGRRDGQSQQAQGEAQTARPRRAAQTRSENLSLGDSGEKKHNDNRNKPHHRPRPQGGKPQDQNRKQANRAPDPDSPFAALLALKDKMGKN